MVVNLVVEVKQRWWLPVYLRALALFCIIMKREPDYDKFHNLIIRHGISQKMKMLRCDKKD